MALAQRELGPAPLPRPALSPLEVLHSQLASLECLTRTPLGLQGDKQTDVKGTLGEPHMYVRTYVCTACVYGLTFCLSFFCHASSARAAQSSREEVGSSHSAAVMWSMDWGGEEWGGEQCTEGGVAGW